MFVSAGSPIFFLKEHRFAVRCRVITLRQLFMDTVYAVIHVEYVFIAYILYKYWMRNSISHFYDVCTM